MALDDNHPPDVKNDSDETKSQTDPSKQNEGSNPNSQAKNKNWFYRLNPIGWFYRLQPIEKFTALLCTIGLFQGWAFIQSERAFIFPSNIAFDASSFAPEFNAPLIELNIEIQNSGRSPARIYKLTVAVTHELPTNPVYDKGMDYREIAFPPIPPGQKLLRTVDFGLWPGTTARAVSNGDKDFFTFGEIRYGDDFWIWPNRYSRFCFRYFADRLNKTRNAFRACTDPKYTNTD